MPSSRVPDPPNQRALQIAEALCGALVIGIDPLRAGGNNRLYRVEGKDGRIFALKSYFIDDHDPRNRLETETTAFAFLRRHGIDRVPAVLGIDADTGFALFEWLEGETVSNPMDADVDAALDFVKCLKTLTDADDIAVLPEASEACLSGEEVLRQLNARYRALLTVAEDDAELSGFLEEAFNPTLTAAATRARDGYRQANADFDQDITVDGRTLSPSDFGFHNSLRGPGGNIAFVDFEYFGWDDPVKLTADFLLHPAMNLSAAHKRRFGEGARAIFAADFFFSERLRLLFPLYGLRWCLIILNEFLAEKWSRRQFAESNVDRGVAKAQQLKKAYTMLNGVRAELEKEE